MNADGRRDSVNSVMGLSNVAAAIEGGDRWALAGRVVPMDGAGTDQRVAVVEGAKIAEVGDERLLGQVRDTGVPVAEADGGVILPGFVDPHAHVQASSRTVAEMVDVRAPGCPNVEAVLQRLRDQLHRADERGWLVAQGNLFYDQKLEDKRLPTLAELDAISRDVPIIIRAGGHTSVLNTKALEVSDVVAHAGEGGSGEGVIWRDSNGVPTGVVSELDTAMPLPEPTAEELKRELIDGVRELFTRYGTTSIGEISETVEGLRMMDEAVHDGEITARISVFLWAPGTVSIDQACDWEREIPLNSAPDAMRIRGMKLFADGGYSARNAAARTAYRAAYASKKGSRGVVNLNRRQVAAAMRRANEAGLQLAVHANGERAQDVVCAGVELAGASEDPLLRTRVEHAGNLITDDVTVENWRRAGIIPVPQPVFLYNFGDFFPLFLGPAGARGRFHFRRLLDDGWRISGSSDVWIGSEDRQTNPLFSVWCCLKRQTFLGEIVDPEQAITVDEALRMHTINAAHTLGVEDRLGSLEPGKLADIAVLAEDPREVDVDRLPDVPVEAVICNGKVAYTGDGDVESSDDGGRQG